jgi:hypothetical protein
MSPLLRYCYYAIIGSSSALTGPLLRAYGEVSWQQKTPWDDYCAGVDYLNRARPVAEGLIINPGACAIVLATFTFTLNAQL